MNRAEKSAVVEDLREKFLKSTGVIITEYRGLSVAAIQAVRSEFRKEQAEYRVVKNTLAQLAIRDSPLEVLSKDFDGPIAVAIAYGDPVAAAKVAVNTAKEHKHLVLKKGFTDGQVIESVEEMSRMLSKDEARAKLLSTLIAGPQQFLQVLNAVPQTVLYLLQARERQMQEQAEGK